MLVEVGPATLSIAGERDGKPFPFDVKAIEAYVGEILGNIREELPVLKQKACRIKKTEWLSEPARRMIRAVKVVDEASLTPMAAVAGTVADLLKERLTAAERFDFLSVNNGGDISLFNAPGRAMRIGIGDINRNVATPYVLKMEGGGSFGIASSGFGGRSFTLGLADVVSVIADSAALADAAATFIANKTTTQADVIVRRKAGEIDPLTDIPEEMVTVERGELEEKAVKAALKSGWEQAAQLKSIGIIRDALVILSDHIMHTIDENSNLRLEEVSHGNQKNSDDC
ncbi:MAG: hypothetical protein A4E57_03802 [Syntrophorhabdaceae bacterium PtaU1.Bin034]|nr:MAG: hypothetical protein A4E57_03802 [Syntrophorhabdaceae bacterium PtaU1.Bin034]